MGVLAIFSSESLSSTPPADLRLTICKFKEEENAGAQQEQKEAPFVTEASFVPKCSGTTGTNGGSVCTLLFF
jgi:hypothetical protein